MPTPLVRSHEPHTRSLHNHARPRGRAVCLGREEVGIFLSNDAAPRPYVKVRRKGAGGEVPG
jgi:hypothetical protein